MPLCQPSGPSVSSGQQHPVPHLHLGEDGVSTQPCPHGLQGAGGWGEHPSVLALEGTSSPGTGKGSALPFSAWAAPGEPVLGLIYIQPGEILRRPEKCHESVG